MDASNKSSILEVKYISNYQEAHDEANKKHPLGIPGNPSYNEKEHNNAVFAKRHEEMLKLFKIETLSLPISNQFAEKLYEKMVSFISTFKGKGLPSTPLIGGYSITFRTVVEDEVWSLGIHMAKENVFKMDGLCLQIIADARANQFNEKKYMSALNTF